MAHNDALIFSLLQSVKSVDPRLHDLLREIANNLLEINHTLYPHDEGLPAPETPTTVDVTPASFTFTLIPDGVRFDWSRTDFNTAYFQLRKGTVWDTADVVLTTSTTSAIVDPLLAGVHNYLLKGISIDGTFSTGTLSLELIIPPVGTPTLTYSVIDNNVLLYWTIPTSVFRISHYVIDKNGVTIGQREGTFTAIFEQVAGTYTYGVVAYDIAGNASAKATVPVTVSQPPDYILLDQESDPTFTGTITDGIRETNPYRILFSTKTETWEDHFANRGWSNIQDQINAGYPLYIQPSDETGKYIKTFDYGTIYTNCIINIQRSVEAVYGTVNIQTTIEYSDDNITYSTPVVGTSVFAASVRYVRVTLDFTAVA